MVRSSRGNVQFKIANDMQITLAVQQLDGARRYYVLLRSHSDQGFEHWANGGLQVLVRKQSVATEVTMNNALSCQQREIIQAPTCAYRISFLHQRFEPRRTTGSVPDLHSHETRDDQYTAA